ncbi:MAG: type II toxin-antitoxin system MqsA family antitoxin [Anaerolineales bacterium]|nr:type II toxin-antitoxin system MqsA family antitoxin [Anaerolineales bacterium]
MSLYKLIMKCLICLQSETVSGFTSIPFERGEFRVVINNVPAQVCPNCGEAYVDEDTAARLLSKAESVLDEGVREGVCEY